MRKIAVFVEGFTELSFVRELVLKSFNYTNVQVKCSLLHSGQFQNIRFSFPQNCLLDGNSNYHIICCQGDAIVSKIKPRKKYLTNNGFTKIIGLRDIYSEEYNEYSEGLIDGNLIQELVDAQNAKLSEILNDEIEGHITFSQMETECWYLSMNDFFKTKNVHLSQDIVNQIVSLHGDPNDVENSVYQPSKCIELIYEKVGEIYAKKQSQAESLASYLTKEHADSLYLVEHTKWFNKLFDLLELG